MSLAINKDLKSFRVLDKRVDISGERYYKIAEGGSYTTPQPFGANQWNSSGISFECNIPSKSTIIDRIVWIEVPVQITLTGDGSGTGNIYQETRDAFRAFPLSAITSSQIAKINGMSVSLESYKVVRHLMRYYDWDKSSSVNMSGCPSMLDQSQNYEDMANSIRNPLANYQSSDAWSNPRGTFPITVVSNTPTSAVITATLHEPMFVSPFLWSEKDQEPGLVNVDTIYFNMQFLNQIQGIWSHMFNTTSDSQVITNISLSITSQPQIYMRFITPKETSSIPKSPIYSYYNIQDNVTNGQTISVQGQIFTINSNTLQLGSVPSKVYVLARPSDSSYNDPTTTDSYAQPVSISVLFNNVSSQLATSSPNLLYDMSVANGLKMSWPQASKYVGYPLALDFSRDIALSVGMAPGLLGRFTFQVTANFKHLSSSPVSYELHLIVVSEGIITIPDNSTAIQQVGVITPQDIVDSASLPLVPYDALENVYGGDFLGSLKSVYNKVKPFLKVANKVLEKVPVTSPFATAIAPLLGDGAKRKDKNKKIKGKGFIGRDRLVENVEEFDMSD
jgi:hypothetical protein